MRRSGLAILLSAAVLLPVGLAVRAAGDATHGDKVIERHTYRLDCSDCHDGGDLGCGDCHDAYGPGGAYDFTDHGYDPKDPLNVICAQCHGVKTSRGFNQDHAIHLGKKFDCAWCHHFTRPERNLKTPPNYHAEEDVLTVASVKRKLSATKPDADSLSLSGRFALVDPDVDLSAVGITIRWGALDYGIPAGGAVRKGTANVFTVKSPKGMLPVFSATFDLVKMSFKLSFKKASIGDQGDSVEFRLLFDTFDESVTIHLD